MESTSIAAVGIIIALLGFAFTVFKYVGAQVDGAYKAANAIRDTLLARMDAVAESESKRRHDLAGQVTTVCAQIQMDVKRLERDTATRGEVLQLEQRLTAGINEVKGEVKQLGDKLSLLPLLDAQVKDAKHLLNKVLVRLGTERAPERGFGDRGFADRNFVDRSYADRGLVDRAE